MFKPLPNSENFTGEGMGWEVQYTPGVALGSKSRAGVTFLSVHFCIVMFEIWGEFFFLEI